MEAAPERENGENICSYQARIRAWRCRQRTTCPDSNDVEDDLYDGETRHNPHVVSMRTKGCLSISADLQAINQH